ncbi:hypothetical protein LCGC14_2302630 [marine sediment metagenome]|uniref:DUF2061 domain-containing protein n=1 Tax=marine sediment metagenome TaxID=412755 RepID=A0A0F9DAG3_9ZZZZ
MATRKQSFIKALSWRVIAVIVTVTIARILIGDTTIALEIGAIDTLIKITLFYAHERVWLNLETGTITIQ